MYCDEVVVCECAESCCCITWALSSSWTLGGLSSCHLLPLAHLISVACKQHKHCTCSRGIFEQSSKHSAVCGSLAILLNWYCHFVFDLFCQRHCKHKGCATAWSLHASCEWPVQHYARFMTSAASYWTPSQLAAGFAQHQVSACKPSPKAFTSHHVLYFLGGGPLRGILPAHLFCCVGSVSIP